MAAWYFMSNDRQRAGPLDDHQIQGMIAAGRIEPETMMWRAGFAGWVPASTVPELWTNAGGHRFPPTASRGGGRISPPLWNPTAAVNWSLVFSVGFGAWLHAKNWKALNEPQKASKSMIWAYVGFAAFLAFTVGQLLQPPVPTLLSMSPLGVYLGVLFSWYFISARSQVLYIQTQFGNKYARQQWIKPIGVAAAVWVALLILNLIASGIKPTPNPRRTTTRARAPDPEFAPDPEPTAAPESEPTPAPESMTAPEPTPAPAREAVPEPNPALEPTPAPAPTPTNAPALIVEPARKPTTAPRKPGSKPEALPVPKFALNQPAITLFHKLSDDIGKSDVLKFPEYVACQKEVDALKSLVGLLGVAKNGKRTLAFDLPNMAINAKRELDTREKWPDSPNTVRSHAAAEFRAKMDALQLWSPSQLSRAQDRVLKFQSRALFTYPELPRPFAQTQMLDMDRMSKSIIDSLKKASDLTSQERIDTMRSIMHFCLRLSVSQRFDIEQSKAAVAQSADLSDIKRVLAAVVAAGPSDDVGAAQNVLNVIQRLLPSTPSSNGGLAGQGVYWSKYSMRQPDTQKFLRSSYWPTLGLKGDDISCNDLFEGLICAVCPTASQGDSLKQMLADFRQSMGWR